MKEKMINVILPEVYKNDEKIIERIKNQKVSPQNLRLWRFSGTLQKSDILNVIKKDKEEFAKGTLMKIKDLAFLEHISNISLVEIEVEDTDTLIVEVNLEEPDKNVADLA